MSEESGFKILVTNQSNTERIIRAVIAVILILAYLAIPSSVNNSIALVGLGVAGVLLFNAASGNCYIYRTLGINTCPLPDVQE
ncbi:MAG: hypothetical protein CMA65_05440 [Euryarchaeota archaeon]|jgi:hypothetical protein|nr:hypothetical protein [Euryarchaeota archaeon]|tara:strand:+ start:484 stop:732 length:249 start_codon:yes stop_codon:yes gene_type:complete